MIKEKGSGLFMEKITDSLKMKHPILIQGAMDSEICHLLHSLDKYHEEDLFGFSFFIMNLVKKWNAYI